MPGFFSGAMAGIMSIPETASVHSGIRAAGNDVWENFNKNTASNSPLALPGAVPALTADSVAAAVKAVQALPPAALPAFKYNGVMNAYYAYGLNPTEENAQTVINLAEQSLGKVLNDVAPDKDSNNTGNMLQYGSKGDYTGKPYSGKRNPEVDFTDKKGNSTLNNHYSRHGDSYSSAGEYKSAARNFLEKPPTLTTQSFVTKEGTYFRYDTATNEFGIMNKYGGVSTYYKPPTGMDYWLEQIKKYSY